MSEETEQAVATSPVRPDRYISGITSTCRFCGYEEMIVIPDGIGYEDIVQAIIAVLTPCPECQERLRRDIEHIELAEFGEF